MNEGGLLSGSPSKNFTAILALFERSEPVDLVTLTEVLKKMGILEEVGGIEYLNSLVNSVPTAANISYYARIIKEKSILRKLINRSTEIISRAFAGSGEVDDILDQAERTIFEISEDRVRPSFYPSKISLNPALRPLKDSTRNVNSSPAFPPVFPSWMS